MGRSKGKSGDFHQGVPDKHIGNKGDTTDDIRSKGELRKAIDGGLNVDQQTIDDFPQDSRPKVTPPGAET